MSFHGFKSSRIVGKEEHKYERSETRHSEYCEENQPHNWEFVHTADTDRLGMGMITK